MTKRGLLTSYFDGITDSGHGERYGTLIRFFIPEFITALLLYSMPFWVDAAFIGHLKSTSTYATLGVTNNLLHLILKVAEAFGVGTIVLSGQFNGREDYKSVGRSLRGAFWLACFVGAAIASVLYFGAPIIFHWYGVKEKLITLGIPFLRLRAIGVFFMFVYFALIGFLRGIKNTKTPMHIFVLGVLVFISFDYVLIFGKLGFPALGLQGSALATIMQYSFMLVLAVGYIFYREDHRKYGIELFAPIRDGQVVKHLLSLSWPVVLDKAILAASYIWLAKMISPMGTCGVATFCVIKDMERFAFLPAIAAAQVVTLLVSNDFGARNWQAIKSNIKKVIFISSFFVFSILLILAFWSSSFIQLFDKKGNFTDFASRSFWILSGLVFLDLLQLILSGALRGAGNVKTVMMVRLLVSFGYFVPLSYMLSQLPIQDQVLKFVLIYGTFYVGQGLMSIFYIHRFRSDAWKA
ncbi:MAG: MATE family efflux transporter [bacterium]|nr:MATE family efflux transporter [bacterium]